MAQHPPVGQGLLIFKDSSSHSLRHTTLSRNLLDEWSARRTDLYLTTCNTHKTDTSMFPAGFEPAIPKSERSQTQAFDLVGTGIGTGMRHFCALNNQSRSMTVIFILSIYPSVRASAWNSVPLPWRVFAKFLVWNFYSNFSKYSDFDKI